MSENGRHHKQSLVGYITHLYRTAVTLNSGLTFWQQIHRPATSKHKSI